MVLTQTQRGGKGGLEVKLLSELKAEGVADEPQERVGDVGGSAHCQLGHYLP